MTHLCVNFSLIIKLQQKSKRLPEFIILQLSVPHFTACRKTSHYFLLYYLILFYINVLLTQMESFDPSNWEMHSLVWIIQVWHLNQVHCMYVFACAYLPHSWGTPAQWRTDRSCCSLIRSPRLSYNIALLNPHWFCLLSTRLFPWQHSCSCHSIQSHMWCPGLGYGPAENLLFNAIFYKLF